MLLYKTVVTDGESDLALTFFNNRYIPSLLREGQDYVFRGKVTGSFSSAEMLSPEFLPISKAFPLSRLYPATQGLTSRIISLCHAKRPAPASSNPARPYPPMPCAANIGTVPPGFCPGTHPFSKIEAELDVALLPADL